MDLLDHLPPRRRAGHDPWYAREGVAKGEEGGYLKFRLLLDNQSQHQPSTCDAELCRAVVLQCVKPKYVKRGYQVLCTHLITLLLVLLAAAGVVRVDGWKWVGCASGMQLRVQGRGR